MIYVSGSPTSWFLHGGNLWHPNPERRPTRVLNVTQSASRGLRLSGLERGDASIDSDDGSWGGLIAPRNLAVDADGRLFLLTKPGEKDLPRVMKFDEISRAFVPFLRNAQDDEPGPLVSSSPINENACEFVNEEAGQIVSPSSIAAAGWSLYVTNPGRSELLVVDTARGSIRQTLTPSAQYLPWRPLQVTTAGGVAYVLDALSGRVFRHRPGEIALRLIGSEASSSVTWQRIAVDSQGRVAVQGLGLDNKKVLERINKDGSRHAVESLEDLPGLFAGAPLRFRTTRTKKSWLSVPPWYFNAKPDEPALAFDEAGLPFDPDANDVEEMPALAAKGTWISPRLDSSLPGCVWDRIDLELREIPRGTIVATFTYTTDNAFENSPPDQLSLWDACDTIASLSDDDEIEVGSTRDQNPREVFIQSRGGRYLWMRLELAGDGMSSPAVDAFRIHFPRESLAARLPAVFAEDQEGHAFLERFLGALQSEWRAIEGRVEDIAGMFDPEAVPATTPDKTPGAATPLSYLAGWVALPRSGLESQPEKLREFLQEALKKPAGKGTPEGLRSIIRAWVAASGGPSVSVQTRMGFPRLIEGFRLRRALTLGRPEAAEIGRGSPLWGTALSERTHLGRSAVVGQSRLISPGTPELDPFARYASTVRVVMPSGWARGESALDRLEGLLDQEVPAHVAWELTLVAPGMRLDIQSTLGVDTILGGPARTQIGPGETSLGPRLGATTHLSADPRRAPPPFPSDGYRLGLDQPLS